MIRTQRAHLNVEAQTHAGMTGKNNEDRYAITSFLLEENNRLPVLLVEEVGAVDPITSEVIARDRDSKVGIELLSSAWEVPITVAEPTPPRRGHSLTLRRDHPLQWPVTSEAWGVNTPEDLARVDARLRELAIER